MKIQFRMDEKKRGSFFIEQDGRQAELDFEVKDKLLNAYHTGVRPELRVRVIAARLFDKMIHFAREEGYKVIPPVRTSW